MWGRGGRSPHGRLLATAIGSFSIFPGERLGPHDLGPEAPETVAD